MVVPVPAKRILLLNKLIVVFALIIVESSSIPLIPSKLFNAVPEAGAGAPVLKSIEMKYFEHCGAWCMFDYRDPRSGWFWEPYKKEWNYIKNLYKICPENEFEYAFDRFLENGC